MNVSPRRNRWTIAIKLKSKSSHFRPSDCVIEKIRGRASERAVRGKRAHALAHTHTHTHAPSRSEVPASRDLDWRRAGRAVVCSDERRERLRRSAKNLINRNRLDDKTASRRFLLRPSQRVEVCVGVGWKRTDSIDCFFCFFVLDYRSKPTNCFSSM